MEEVACIFCGKKTPRHRMIRRRLNGQDRYCCSVACEVRWEKANLLGVCG